MTTMAHYHAEQSRRAAERAAAADRRDLDDPPARSYRIQAAGTAAYKETLDTLRKRQEEEEAAARERAREKQRKAEAGAAQRGREAELNRRKGAPGTPAPPEVYRVTTPEERAAVREREQREQREREEAEALAQREREAAELQTFTAALAQPLDPGGRPKKELPHHQQEAVEDAYAAGVPLYRIANALRQADPSAPTRSTLRNMGKDGRLTLCETAGPTDPADPPTPPIEPSGALPD